MWTPEFEAYVASAQAKPQLWRLIVGIIMAAVIYITLFITIFAVFAIVLMTSTDLGAQLVTGPASEDQIFTQTFQVMLGENPSSVLMILFTFIGMFLGAIVAAAAMHDRPWGALFGPDLIRRFIPAALITFGIGIGSAVFAIFGSFELVPNLPLSTWIAFLLPALFMLLIQTGAEEILFRGYLQTQLAARFRSPIVWMVLPSIAFGLLHVSGTENDHLIVAATTLVGLLAADLTRVTGGIGAAWGLHFANNVQALLIVSLPGPLSGLSLYNTPFGPDDKEVLPMLLAQDMVLLIIIWAAIRLYLARRG